MLVGFCNILKNLTTWTQLVYFPSERKSCYGFYPSSSARLESANLGSSGKHATTRPPRAFLINCREVSVIFRLLYPGGPLFDGNGECGSGLERVNDTSVLNRMSVSEFRRVNGGRRLRCGGERDMMLSVVKSL
jgi:hypothetical protein